MLRRRSAVSGPSPGRVATADLDLREQGAGPGDIDGGAGETARVDPVPARPPAAVYGPSPLQTLLRRMPLRFLVASALAGLLAGSAGAFVVARDPHVYQAQGSLMVDQPMLISADNGPATIDKLGAVRLKYADLVVTQPVAGAAARQLGMGESQVASSVFADAPNGSLLLVVGARSGDPQTAVRISRAVTASLVAYADADQARYQIPPNQRLLLRQVIPTGSALRIAPTGRRIREVGVAAGLIVFLLVAFGIYVARPIPLVV